MDGKFRQQGLFKVIEVVNVQLICETEKVFYFKLEFLAIVYFKMDTAILNRGEDTEFECRGYRRNLLKTVITHVISILCFGIPYLIAHWKPDWKIKWYRNRCPLSKADTVMITPIFGHQPATLETIVTGMKPIISYISNTEV